MIQKTPGITRLLDKLEQTPGASQALPGGPAPGSVLDHRSRITSAGRPGQTDGDSGAQAMESLTTSELRVLIAGLERVRGGLG